MIDTMPLGQKMPDDPTDPRPIPELEEMSLDELNAAIDGRPASPPAMERPTGAPAGIEDDDLGDSPKPIQRAELPQEPEAKTTVGELESAAAQGKETEDGPVDPIEARIREMEQLHANERQRWDGQMEIQRAHNSRLAGELGFLKKQTASASTAEPADRPDPYGEEAESPLLRQLDERLSRFEQAIQSEAVRQAITAEVASLNVPELTGLTKEIEAARVNYAADIEALNSATDPEVARLLARGLARSITADARDMRRTAERAEATKRKADESELMRSRKLAAGATRTANPSSPVRPARKSPDDMSLDEINAVLSGLG